VKSLTIHPAKYDANGNAGIINIIYKKRTKRGILSHLPPDWVQLERKKFND
jgi:hypothetical protein